MFALENATFACGVRSAHEWSFEEARGQMEVGRCLLALEPRLAGMQTESQIEPATSVGVILPETGQLLLLCLLQLWQQLQRVVKLVQECKFLKTHFTSVLRKQFVANDTFLREANRYK